MPPRSSEAQTPSGHIAVFFQGRLSSASQTEELILARVAAALAPGAAITIAAGAAIAVPAVGEPLTAFLAPSFPVLFASSVLLAIVFGRSRAAMALLALGAAAMAIERFSEPAEMQRFVAVTAALLVPLNLGAASILPDRPPLSASAFLRFLAIAAQAGAAALVWEAYLPTLMAVPQHVIFGALPVTWMTLPQPAYLSFLAATATATGAVFVRRDAVTAGLLWSLMLTFLALSSRGQNHRLLLLAGAGLAILASVIQTAARAASRDGLTGLPGRQRFHEALADLGSRYTIAMVDIDRFKRVNDTYGHDVGDQVLRMVASHLAQLPGSARAYRFGGEEFTVLFPNRELGEAAPVLEGLRLAIASEPFTLRAPDRPSRQPRKSEKTAGKRPQIRVTVSIGAASRGTSSSTATHVLKAADKALYKAKSSGRNRLVLA